MEYYTKDKICDLRLFIIDNYEKLQGAAVFMKNKKSKISNVVSFTCKKQVKELKDKELQNFVPSHIASCFKGADERLYLLDIKPPKSTIRPLYSYLKNTKDEYVIILRNENIDLDKYNTYMQQRSGLWYGLISAIQSVFKHITFKHGMHCSENYIYAYNQQGLYFDINANKSTPANLMCYLLKRGTV